MGGLSRGASPEKEKKMAQAAENFPLIVVLRKIFAVIILVISWLVFSVECGSLKWASMGRAAISTIIPSEASHNILL